MGYGDTLMSIGEAKRLYRVNQNPVMIVGRDGRPIRSELFDGVPYLTTKPLRSPYQRLINGPGARPYIAAKTETHWTWRPYKPEPATVILTAEEKAFAEPYRGMVLLEPTVKKIGHSNKDWGAIHWQQLDSMLRAKKIPAVQPYRQGDHRLLHSTHVLASTFRQAIAVLSVCRAAVLPEGGLMHAAAAVGVRSVICYGGFISPDITGYKMHRNLFTGGKACGMRVDCQHCRMAMADITSRLVFDTLMDLLREYE